MKFQPRRLKLVAPLSGVMVPLESVPDPVFAQKMVGDGVCIDPASSELLAPIAGKIVDLQKASHALTIAADFGVEVLLHVGIDTVELNGKGFEPLVREGDVVQAGQPLVRFDLEYVRREARSPLTLMLIANAEVVAHYLPATGTVRAGWNVALTLDLVGEGGSEATAADAPLVGEIVRLLNPNGLHARPAAVLASAAKKFQAVVQLVRGEAAVNAKSVVAIMGLSTLRGDPVSIRACGADADDAVCVLTRLLAEGCGEQPGDAVVPVEATQPGRPVAATATKAGELAGVCASPGLAVGVAVQYRTQVIDVPEHGEGSEIESARLGGALLEARAQLEVLKGNADAAGNQQAQILAAHQELLDDPELIDLTVATIRQGKSAGFAWRQAYSEYGGQLEKLDSEILRERANDIRDVGRRVLLLLAGVKPARPEVPPGAILIAEDLTPSDAAALDPSRVFGLCTTTGGATSHVAILARSAGIPAVCGIDAAALSVAEGALVVLDGTRGVLHCRPSATEVAEARSRMARAADRRAEEHAAAQAPAVTVDGHRVEVAANIRNAGEAREAVLHGAEGVGLLRSEFLFDHRTTAPTHEEQAREYVAVARELGAKRTLVVRTLDVGGDKPLPYLPLPKEDNPFLGMRGIRASLDRPEMLRVQLRAILEASDAAQLHVMFPMVSSLEELRAAKAILAEESRACGRTAKAGIMVEVPAAAVMADVLAREADFFSIGTNDLTQYTLAMDRGHPKLARQADGLDPAVLRMIALTVQGAHRHGKWVGVCGGIAADAMAVPVLVGLGIDELSIPIPAIASVKALIKRLSFAECAELAREVLTMATVAEVRNRLSVYAE